MVDGITAEVGTAAGKVNLMVSNGGGSWPSTGATPRCVLRMFNGKADDDAIIGDDPQLRRKVPELTRVHFTIAASDFEGAPPNGRWKAVVPDSAILTMSCDEDPRIEAL